MDKKNAIFSFSEEIEKIKGKIGKSIYILEWA